MFSPASPIPLGSLVPRTIALSHSSEYLILADNRYIELVARETDYRFPAIDVRDRGGIRCIKWSPVGHEFFCAFDTGEILVYRIDKERERYAYCILRGMKGICDGAISYDGRRLAVAGGSRVMIWTFVKGKVPYEDSWVLDVDDLYVDANRLPDGPWEGRALPLRVWWPQWTSEDIYVAYANRGICLFGTGGGPSGYVKRFIPTFTSDRG